MPLRQLRDGLAGWEGRIASADPAHQRVRLATRAAASLGLALAVMAPLTSSAGQPVTVVMMAGITAMVASTSVKDGRRSAALLTIAEAGAIAIAVVTLAASLSSHPLAADIAFVAVMSGSVLLRRWGQRGFALGQLAFMTYFFALFLETRPHQLPWMVLAVLVGAACTAIVRCVLLPDRPAADLRRMLRALQGRVADLAEEARLWLTTTRAEPDPQQLRTRRLVRASSRLGEVALLIERQLEVPNAADLLLDPESVRGQVFDVEVAAEHLADAVRHDGPALTTRAQARFAARAGRLAAAARAGRPVRADRLDALALTARSVKPRPDDAPHLAEAFARVEHAVGELSRIAVTGGLLDGFAAAPGAPPVAVAGVAAPGLALTTRTAIQVAVAGALSMLAGKQISSARWFWAVLAAYVVFVNATTRTATVRRALGRVVGTVLGVAGGLLLGKAIAGDPHLAVALILVLVFTAFWVVNVSYTALVLCFTLTLAALYSILGTLSFSLLRLRIEETLAGALIGGLVALVVLPRRGSTAVDEEIDRVLESTGEVLDRMIAGEDSGAVRAAVRRLDQRFQDLRVTMLPTVTGVPGPVPMSRRRQLLHVASVRYWTRSVAVGSADLPQEQLLAVRSDIERVRQLIQAGGTGELPTSTVSAAGLRHLDEALAALVAERSGLPPADAVTPSARPHGVDPNGGGRARPAGGDPLTASDSH